MRGDWSVLTPGDEGRVGGCVGERSSLIFVSGRLAEIRITNSELCYFKTMLLALHFTASQKKDRKKIWIPNVALKFWGKSESINTRSGMKSLAHVCLQKLASLRLWCSSHVSTPAEHTQFFQDYNRHVTFSATKGCFELPGFKGWNLINKHLSSSELSDGRSQPTEFYSTLSALIRSDTVPAAFRSVTLWRVCVCVCMIHRSDVRRIHNTDVDVGAAEEPARRAEVETKAADSVGRLVLHVC